MTTGQLVLWVIDTSSVAEVRRSIENAKKPQVFARMGTLVRDGRLIFPKQVVDEFERVADLKSPDLQYGWHVNFGEPTLEEIKDVLRAVP